MVNARVSPERHHQSYDSEPDTQVIPVSFTRRNRTRRGTLSFVIDSLLPAIIRLPSIFIPIIKVG